MTHTESTAPLKPEALKAATAAVTAEIDRYWNDDSVEPGHEPVAAAAIRAYLAASPAPQQQGVKVKALEWCNKSLPVMEYHAECDEDGRWRYAVVRRGKDAPYTLTRYGADVCDYSSLEAAKAAAQSDYEARILSALTIQEPASEPVAWIANCCICGRVVDTREQSEGGDEFGCELNDGGWTCSIECWDKAAGEPPAPAVPADELVERMNAATMGFDWRDLPDDASIPAVPLLREAAARLTSLIAENARWQKNWDANVQEMSERFRAVNVAKVMAGTNVDLLERATRAEAALARALEERDKLRADLAFADRQSASVEALLEPHVKWEPGTIRVCPLRDAACPHGLACPYTDGYDCKPGWNSTLQSQRPE